MLEKKCAIFRQTPEALQLNNALGEASVSVLWPGHKNAQQICSRNHIIVGTSSAIRKVLHAAGKKQLIFYKITVYGLLVDYKTEVITS